MKQKHKANSPKIPIIVNSQKNSVGSGKYRAGLKPKKNSNQQPKKVKRK